MKNGILILCAGVVSISYGADVDPINQKQFLQELETIATKHEGVSANQQRQRFDFVLKAAASRETAIALYEDAIMATQFMGANRENGQFRDWKKKQDDQLKDNNFRESVRLHLFYLALTLKKAAETKPEILAPQVADYLQVLSGSGAAIQANGSLLKVSMSDSIFTRWQNWGLEVAKAKEWEMIPGDGDKIAAKYLLPIWRKQKNPALLAYWDAKIAQETVVASYSKLNFEQTSFANVRKPSLLWMRAQDMLILDQPNRADQEMLSLIKTYPNHPEVSEWIATLKHQLDPKNAPAPVPVEPTATP